MGAMKSMYMDIQENQSGVDEDYQMVRRCLLSELSGIVQELLAIGEDKSEVMLAIQKGWQ